MQLPEVENGKWELSQRGDKWVLWLSVPDGEPDEHGAQFNINYSAQFRGDPTQKNVSVAADAIIADMPRLREQVRAKEAHRAALSDELGIPVR